jgi:hypothetical protein
MRSRYVALVSAFAGVALVALAGGGCEAIVGNTVGTNIQCMSVTGEIVCPQGQYCVGGMCRSCPGTPGCPGPDAGFDTGHDSGMEADTNPRDVVQDMSMMHHDASETSTLLPLGQPCSIGSACKSGVCGTSTLLSATVQTPGNASVCTKPCCTSADCDDPDVTGYICFPSVGGDYCIDPTWIGNPSAVGTGLPGTACSGGAGCRSGVCSPTNTCQDTCCVDGNCGNGTVCQNSGLDGMNSFNCGPSGGKVRQGGNCTGSPCQSNLCVGSGPFYGYCIGACCNSGQCKTMSLGGPTTCNWLEVTDADGGVGVLRGCSEAINAGAGLPGSTCGSSTDCESGLCYKKACTTPCCTDTDCTGGGKCSYASFILSPLTLDLQVCVPPA